jgi:hypothetical protein
MNEILIREFTHYRINEEIRAIGGQYTLTNESRMSFGNREVLYITGYAVFDTSCCGSGGCGYAIVPGYIVNWKKRQNKEGLSISDVEPVVDPSAQKEIRELIKGREMVQEIRFES